MCLSCLEKVRLIRSQVERQRADREVHQAMKVLVNEDILEHRDDIIGHYRIS